MTERDNEIREIGKSAIRRSGSSGRSIERLPRKEGKQTAKLKQLTDQEIDKTFDEIEESLLRGRVEQAARLTDSLAVARQRLPNIIAERLITGRSKIPILAFDALLAFSGSRVKTHLKAIAESPRAADLTRFAARRRMDWPERGEAKARLAFLNSLRDPESAMVSAVQVSTVMWPPDGEVLEEVVGYVEASAPEFGLRVIERCVRELEPDDFLWLGRPLLHVRHPAVQLSALAQVAKIDGQTSGGAIRRLARAATDPKVRAEAEAIARRLEFRVVASGRHAQATHEEFPQIDTVWASSIDGSGGQIVLLRRNWGLGLYLVADVFHKDSWGVNDAFGFYRMPGEQIDDMVEDFSTDGVELLEISLSEARGILAAAAEINGATGHRISPAFEVWEPLFHDTYPPHPDEPVEVTELDDSPFSGKRQLYLKSRGLLDHPFFDAWFFNPDQIKPALGEIQLSDRIRRLGDNQLTSVIKLVVDDQTRRLLRQRLRRQAWLLERADDVRSRDIALAAAAALSDDRRHDLGKHPLLREMVQRSILNLFGEFYF